MSRMNIFKTLVLEVVSIILFIIIYNFSLYLFNNIISTLLSYSLVFLFSIYIYGIHIYKEKINYKVFFKYLLVFMFCFLIKNKINNFLNADFNDLVILKKILIISIYIFISVYLKISVFLNTDSYFDSLKKCIKEINKYFEDFINKKNISFIFKFLPHNIVLFVSTIFILIFTIIFIKSHSSFLIYSQPDYSANIGPIINKTVTINFNDINDKSIDDDIVNSICIPFGTYGRNNNSLLKFELIKNEKVFFNQKINTSKLYDGQSYCIRIKDTSVKKLKTMKLNIKASKSNKMNNVTIFKNKKGEYGFSLFKIKSKFSIKNIIIIVFGLVFLVINYIINKYHKRISFQTYFLILLIYIVPILFIYPPLEVPDEPAHFRLSYVLSQHGLAGFKKEDIFVPKNIDCLNYSKIEARDKVDNIEDISKCIAQKKNMKVSSLFNSNSKMGLSFLGYIFSAVFLKFADFFTNSPLIIFYLGRIGNLLFSLFILYRALKIAPCHKKILLFIITIPMFIQQMCSYSYDSPLNSICILFISYFLAIMNDTIKFDKWLKLKIMLILIFLLAVKIVYLPLMVLLFLIPNEKYGSKKRKIIYFIAIFALLCLFYICMNKIFISSASVVPSTTGKSNLSYLIANPLELISIVINTIKINGMFYVTSVFGYFSWFKFQLNNLSIVLYFLFFLYVILGESSILKRIKTNKIVIFLSIMIMTAAIFASMYFFWSKYKLNYVDGVQGRYFIPLLGILSILLIPKKSFWKINDYILYSFINIMLFQYIVYLIAFFY